MKTSDKLISTVTLGLLTPVLLALLLFFCICSAVMALGESSICSQIRSMLGLPFNVEMWMIWLLIIGGGAFLLGFQYLIPKIVFKSTLSKTLIKTGKFI